MRKIIQAPSKENIISGMPKEVASLWSLTCVT